MTRKKTSAKNGCRPVGASESNNNDASERVEQKKKPRDFPRAYQGVGGFRPFVTLGPPGCGKTRHLLETFTEELRNGVVPERIALVTFTRAARKEALDRALAQLAIARSRFAWVRTIHSAAFSLLELSHEQILDSERLAEFARLHDYELTIDGHRIDDDGTDPLLVRGRSKDDALLFAYEWGRNCLLDLDQTLARCPVEDLSEPQFRLFVRRLEEFKVEHGLLDFSDLLELVLEGGQRPDVDVAMIDEAHDLSPLQIAVVEMWFTPCERSYVCADDDQAIYGWQGASPDWIHELARRREPRVLAQSHRVPIVVHALAQRIIRPNVDRVAKQYEPTRELGRIIETDLAEALDLVERSEKAFILCRNRLFIGKVATDLRERAVPFTVEGWGGRSPLDDDRAVKAVKLALRLQHGDMGPFPTNHVSALLHFVEPATDWVHPDARERVRRRGGKGSYMRPDLIEQLGFARLLEIIEDGGALAALPKLARDDRRYFQRLIDRHGEVPDPTATVTTIHSAKGREAPLVVVLPDMTRTTYRDYMRGGLLGNEVENRVFYVAVTRTKDTLVLVHPRGRRHFEYPRVVLAEGVL